MRVLPTRAKSKRNFCLAALIGFCGVALWFLSGRAPRESWQLLATGKLVKIEAEQAIYEKPNSPDYFLRVRISNLSSQVVGFDRYENSHRTAFPLEPLQASCYLTEGNRPAPVNGMFPIFLPKDEKMVKHSAAAKYRARKLQQIAPGATREFFIMMPKAKIQMARSWKSFPLWWKSKIFLPNDNLRSPYCIVLWNGQVTATDGKSAQWFRFRSRKDYLALKFPVKTKSLP